ncbi:hypothetical protein C8R43DRAFT_868822 [Mycena crocata]|nr:hypothetical protein C8R43DRAFT_868822 [Mycena crocata]
MDVPITRTDGWLASAHVRQGLMPVAPYWPRVVITTRALEVFRVTRLCCPRLGTQAFVRALCDMHGVPPRPFLNTQFSVAFDIYLSIRARVDARVQAALGRDTPDWRLRNACAPCMYRLEGETPIPLPLLVTVDGNNSLRRFAAREREEVEENGITRPGASKERIDERVVPGDYYLGRERVDKWAKEGLDDLMKGFVPDSEEADEGGGCTERWQNMKEDVTGRAWGMYDETGFFPALCRHGFVLVVVDMVKSGELGKYGYAITEHLIRVLGELGLGYDIGCKFGKMVNAVPVLGALAKENNFKALVGSFHGCAHNRRCQLDNLAVYVRGMGLEDLEGCESFFSKSNALAATTRYATRFHRQQAITTYLKHSDTFDVYHSLSLLLANKYRRALKIRATLPELELTMATLGVQSRDVFEGWLEKEKAHLRSLLTEPVQETLEMEYYQKLVNLADLEYVFSVSIRFVPAAPGASYASEAQETRRIEAQRRHAAELMDKTLAAVQDLERRLSIIDRWRSGDAKWEATATMVEKRRYQRALDQLEGLIISRMFELAKVNMAGYKMRKHIAKALQARSKAVKASIDRYNDAADAMTPAKPRLTWDQIVEYAFLADFDLLREGREDIREEPWARPAGRAAMDQHFKLLRAEEEIIRLNLEIPRLVTRIADEDKFLVYHEARLREEGKVALAHQVGVHRMERARFTPVHMERFAKLAKVPGFTASLIPGRALSRELDVPAPSAARDVEMSDVSPPIASQGGGERPHAPVYARDWRAPAPSADDDSDDDDGGKDKEEAEDDDAGGGDGDVDSELVADEFAHILHISHDAAGTVASDD